MAGCTDTPTNDSDPSPTTTTGTPVPPDDEPEMPLQPNATKVPTEAFWDNCDGVITNFDWVGPNPRFEPPPEWTRSPANGYAYDVRSWGLECERFALGAFERPVRMFIDGVGVDGTPATCAKTNTTTYLQTLQSIWVNDTEVVDFLREAYGMPAYYAAIATSREPFAGQATQYVWTMTHDDGSESWIRTIDTDEYGSSHPSSYRWFWFLDHSVSFMQWTQDSAQGSQVSHGHVESPIAMADWHTDYVAVGSYIPELHAHAEIRVFNDLLCTEEAL